MGDGEANHRTVGQVDGALDKSLAKRATAYDVAAVLILDGTCHNLSCRCSIFVNEHHNLSLHELSFAMSPILLARYATSLGIDDHLVLGQQLIGNVDSRLQVAAAILLKVEHKALHAFNFQLLQGFTELLMGSSSEIADADVADGRAYHVGSIDGLDGNLVADNGKRQLVFDACTDDSQFDFCPLGTTESAHDFLLRHLHACNRTVVDRDDAVAGNDAHLL